MSSLKAQLLVSGPSLLDPNFRHTVILIGHHDDEGAAGIILNRPTELTVAEAAPPLAPLAGTGALLFEGGPVEPQQPVVLAELSGTLHTDLPIFGSIGFLTDEIDTAVRASIHRARVFAGYAGWGAGQLEEELKSDAWIVEPARPEDVFTDDPASLWRRILQRKGGAYKRFAMVPADPRVN